MTTVGTGGPGGRSVGWWAGRTARRADGGAGHHADWLAGDGEATFEIVKPEKAPETDSKIKRIK